MIRSIGARVLLGVAALGCGTKTDVTLLRGHAYAPVGPEAVAYVTIRNSGATEDTLLAVSSPLAETTMMHDSRQEGGLVRMTPRDALVIPPGQVAGMAPGGLHLMLSGLTGRIVEGGKLPLRLRFARAGVLEIDVPILRYGAAY